MTIFFNDPLTPDGVFGGRVLNGATSNDGGNDYPMVGGKVTAPNGYDRSVSYYSTDQDNLTPYGDINTFTGVFGFVSNNGDYRDLGVIADARFRIAVTGDELDLTVSIARNKYNSLPGLPAENWYVQTVLNKGFGVANVGLTQIPLVLDTTVPYTIIIGKNSVTVRILGTETVVPAPDSWSNGSGGPAVKSFYGVTLHTSDKGTIGPSSFSIEGVSNHGDVGVVCPTPTATAHGIPGTSSILTMPRFSLRASSGGLNGFSGALPGFSFSSYLGGGFAAVMPDQLFTSSGTSTGVGKVTYVASMGTLSASGSGGGVATFSAVFGGQYSVAANTGAASATSMPAMSLTSLGTSGGVGAFRGAADFSALISGGLINRGVVAASMPMLRVVPSGVFRTNLTGFGVYSRNARAPAAYSSYSFNMLQAVDRNPQNQFDPQIAEATRLLNFGFSQIVRFGNDYYGSRKDGLYKLGGDTDVGAPIPWAFRLSSSDGDSAKLKRIVSAYINGRLKSQAQVALIVGEKGDLAYNYVTPRDATAQTHRVKFGLGVRTRYYSVGVADTAGGKFTVNSIDLEEVILDRKI